jgi:hypothetical protein
MSDRSAGRLMGFGSFAGVGDWKGEERRGREERIRSLRRRPLAARSSGSSLGTSWAPMYGLQRQRVRNPFLFGD